MANAFTRLFLQEDLNFLLTNRIPRHLTTRLAGWLGKVENPLVKTLAIGAWQYFGSVDLSEAAQSEFKSLHNCFIRELKPGARPVDLDPTIVVSPCDALVGGCGTIEGNQLIQAKGISLYPGRSLDRSGAARAVPRGDLRNPPADF